MSVAVRQRCALDPAVKAVDDARETRERRGAAEGETTTGAAQGGGEQIKSRGEVEERNCGDEGPRPSTAGRSDATGATAYRADSEGEGRRRRDGGTIGGGASERRRVRVRPDPGGLTSLGGLWGLGSREPGHAS